MGNLNLNPVSLVFTQGKLIKTDSRKIAKAFKKRHKNVIQAIEKLECSPDFARLNYQLCHEINRLQNGKPIKYYEVTEKGAMRLIMGFTGTSASEIKELFLDAFEEMQTRLEAIDTLYALQQKRDIEQANASVCGRGLNEWKHTKKELDTDLLAIGKIIQPELFTTAH